MTPPTHPQARFHAHIDRGGRYLPSHRHPHDDDHLARFDVAHPDLADPRSNPDPRYVDEEPVPRHREPQRSRWILWVTLAFAWIVGAIVVGYFLIQLWIALTAAPRPGPDPTAPPPGAPGTDVVSDGAVLAQVQASASGRSPSGAPLERERWATPLGPSRPDRHDGGAL